MAILRQELLDHCRQRAREFLLSYQAHYHYHWKSLLLYGKEIPFPSYQVQHTLEDEELALYYAPFFPGRLVYEKWSEEEIRALYRLEKPELTRQLQRLEFSFQVNEISGNILQVLPQK